MSESRHGSLTLWIFASIVLAIGFALVRPVEASHLKIGGDIFLNLLKMLVVPLVVSSVMAGVLGMGDVRRLGKPGLATLGYFLTVTLLAVALGILLVNVIQPGVGFSQAESRPAAGELQKLQNREPETVATILQNMTLMLFTDNLLKSAAEGDLLPLIVFSICFAGLLTTLGPKTAGLATLIVQLNEALMAFVMLVMRLAPVGIFCLVAARFGLAQKDGKLLVELQRVGWYVGTVVAGLAIHLLVVLPAILWLCTRRNPYRFLVQNLRTLLTAFSTASSNATLPVTLETAVDRAGISRQSVEFVIPLGATVNMSGTALYEAVAALFIAQAYQHGPALEPMGQLSVALTATLAAIGAAGIPEAGLVTMLIVLNAVGLPTESMGLILSVDWLLDRCRTAANVFDDVVGAAVVERTFPDAGIEQPFTEPILPAPPAA